MKEELQKHAWAYFTLLLLLLAGGLLFMFAWPNRVLQRWIALGIAVMYFLWGVITHTRADHLTSRIVLEYLCIALLAGLILGMVTY